MTKVRPLETTRNLLELIRAGDGAARERLIVRYLPILRAWAHGRLPPACRGVADTDDMVQVTLTRTLARLDSFEYRHEGAFLAYLRHGVLNAIRQEIRRARRHPGDEDVEESLPDPSPSILEQAIGRETVDRYESALMDLTPEQREATILRVEFGMSYPEIAVALGKPSANAARMLVVRGLIRLAERVGRE